MELSADLETKAANEGLLLYLQVNMNILVSEIFFWILVQFITKLRFS